MFNCYLVQYNGCAIYLNHLCLYIHHAHLPVYLFHTNSSVILSIQHINMSTHAFISSDLSCIYRSCSIHTSYQYVLPFLSCIYRSCSIHTTYQYVLPFLSCIYHVSIEAAQSIQHINMCFHSYLVSIEADLAFMYLLYL